MIQKIDSRKIHKTLHPGDLRKIVATRKTLAHSLLKSIAYERFTKCEGMGIMKKQRDQEPEAAVSLRMWTYPNALKAVPYIRSLAQSLRDGWLELRQAQETVQRTKARPGRPNRDALILLDETQHDIERAEAKLEEIV